MDSERLQQLLRDPPDRSRVGFLALLLTQIQAFLAVFFGRKHPVGFDAEFGSYADPDFVISPGSSSPPPKPLINRDCKRTYLIYNYVSVRVERCTLAGRLAALTRAIENISDYQRAELRCEDPDCPQPDGEVIWAGIGCDATDGPRDKAAVLVRLRCRPQR